MIYYVPDANLAEFEKRMAKLVRRATRLKATLLYTVDRETFRDTKFEFKGTDGKITEKWVRFIKVTVVGDQPKLNGWNFIGTLEHTEAGNVLRMVPGEKAPERYRDQAPFCEHCKLKRLRRDTFLVRHETGTVTQVGSGCLVDFLGHENPHQLAQLATIWIGLEDLARMAEEPGWLGKYQGGLSVERHDLMRFLSLVAEVTLRHGFFSKTVVENMRSIKGPDARLPEVTAYRAGRLLTSRHAEDINEAIEYIPTDAAVKLAEDARGWALRTFGHSVSDDADADEIKASVMCASPRELTDFEHNLHVVAKGESVEPRTFGIAAYLIQAYRKAANLIPEKIAHTGVNAHFGTVGERLKNLKITCEKVITWRNEMLGQGYLLKMRTADGYLVIWRTYNISADNLLEEGRDYVINGTIKKHGEYNDQKQTEISRMKVVSGHPAEKIEKVLDFQSTELQAAAA